MRTLARPRAVLFDWDNTLVDNWPAIREAYNATLAAFGHATWTLEETKLRMRRSLRDSFPELFGPRWEDARAIFYRTFEACHLEALRAMPGAEAAIAAFLEAEVYLGVVSNKSGPILRKEAAHLGWSRRFGRLVGATDAVKDKPAIEPVFLALEASGVAPGPEVWFVGDAAVDMECAHRAGCVPVLVGPGAGEAEQIQRFPPGLMSPDLNHLRSILEGL
ncbi:MAG TPA: HAD family hydrolase [Alphaproteobacteria bacterium]|nr:HAD family hydrolase [Alphaproteobacteria bacterium]